MCWAVFMKSHPSPNDNTQFLYNVLSNSIQILTALSAMVKTTTPIVLNIA